MAGCGGGNKGASGAPTTAVESATGAFGGKGGAVDDRRRAEKALLVVEDFPPNWTSTPHSESTEEPDLERRLAECMRVEPALVGQTASSIDSPDFHLPGARLQVQSSVGLADTVDQARERLAVFERPEMRECLNATVSEAIRRGTEAPDPEDEPPDGAVLGAVTTERVPFPTVGDGTVAYRVTMPVEVAGEQAPVYADLVVAIRGRGGVRLSFLSLGAPFPADVAEKLARTAVDRLPPS